MGNVKTSSKYVTFQKNHDAVAFGEDPCSIAFFSRISLQESTQSYQKNNYLELPFYGNSAEDLMRGLNALLCVDFYDTRHFLKFAVRRLKPGEARVVTLTAKASSTILRGSIQVLLYRELLK